MMRRVIALLVLVWLMGMVLGPGGPVTARAQGLETAQGQPAGAFPPPPQPAVAPAAAALLEKAERTGRVHVIATLTLSGAAQAGDVRAAGADVDQLRQDIAQARSALQADMAGHAAQVYATYATIPAVALRVDAAALSGLLRSPWVSHLQEDVAVSAGLDSSTPVIGAPAVWAAGYDGTGQTVVILDTGIDGAHPFFRDGNGQSRIVAEACFSNAQGADVSLCPNGQQTQSGPGAAEAAIPACLSGSTQLCNHGSHVAGIAAGRGPIFNGVAPNAGIIAIQVFTRFESSAICGSGATPCVRSYISDQLSALDYIYNTLRHSHAIAAVNLSLGDGNYDFACDAHPIKPAVDTLRAAGIATVVVTGNAADGEPTNLIWAPGCVSTVIAVGATTDGDLVWDYSKTHALLKLLAPGVNVTSASVGGGYATRTGTSMAAPHVAGAWAVLKQRDPTASVDDVLDALTVTGVPVPDQRYYTPIIQITRPRIQLDAALAILPARDRILYVKESATGANDGSSWTDAFTDLQSALAAAFSGDQIWVAQGLYKPTSDPADRAATFSLHTGVALYGGFAGAPGTEGDFTARDWRGHLTVLSGDIDNNDTTDPRGVITSTAHLTGTNSYHVVSAIGVVPTATLDGFTITGGYAFFDGSNYSPCYQHCGGGLHNLSASPTLRNLVFSGNFAVSSGGGVYNTSGSDPNLHNIVLRGNSAGGGGGMYNYNYSSPTLTNVAFGGNTAGGGGGMTNLKSCSPSLTNVTFSGNRAEGFGGGLLNWNGSLPVIQNSLFWDNGDSIFNYYASAPTIRRSLAQGCNPGGVWDATCGVDGGDNLADADPLFVAAPDSAAAPTVAGDLRLRAASPAIDQGDNAYLPAGVTTDLADNPRTVNGTVDLGAHEAPPAVLYVDDTAAGLNTGADWPNAFPGLQAGLDYAVPGVQIWVAQGVYTPTRAAAPDDPRSATFQLTDEVAVYGGFAGAAGTEGDFGARDWGTYVTVLSGDLDANDLADPHGVITDTAHLAGANSYHVVAGSGVTTTAMLDGFTVTGGLADGALSGDCPTGCGGGIYNLDGSPTLANLAIRGNKAGNGGGVYNNGSGSAPLLARVAIISNEAANSGGGMNNLYGAAPSLTNVALQGNKASSWGGGMANTESNPSLTNVVFSGNETGSGTSGLGFGGGMRNQSSHPTLVNVTFSGNRAQSAGGGMFNLGSNPLVHNSIFWNNQAGSGSEISNSGSTPTFRHSLVQECNPGGVWVSGCGADGGGNLADADPLLVDPPDPALSPTSTGDLRLRRASPAVDVGANSLLPTGVTMDLADNPRTVNGAVDLGAHEAPPAILYVRRAATGADTGFDWPNAFPGLQAGLDYAVPGVQIWVAQGVYTPTQAAAPDDPRSATFQLTDEVAVYGGFSGTAGTEGDFGARAWQSHLAVLSGDLDGNDLADANGVITATANLAGANAYHVVTGSGVTTTAVLDGFTVTGGLADGATPGGPCGGCGGGIYLDGSPTLTNLVVRGNQAHWDGGGIYNNRAGSAPTLTNVTIIGNRALHTGGGMKNFQGAAPVLTNVSLLGNQGVKGGGMSSTYSSPRLTNVLFSGNWASISGGGLHGDHSSPILSNVTFSGNWATGTGGGMRNESGSNPIIQNAIFWNNRAAFRSSIENGASTPTIRHSLVQECNPGGVWTLSCGTDGGGNLADADPLFADPTDPVTAPTTVGDLRLAAASPAIDAGDNGYVPAGVSTDLDGSPRLRDGDGDGVPTADLGAYEGQSTRWCGDLGAPYVFADQGELGIEFQDAGKVACVAVIQTLAHHPNATVGVQTGRYWRIAATDGAGNPVAGDFTASLTLPHSDPDATTRACRWPDELAGTAWDCGAADGSDTAIGKGAVTRSGISRFSDWAVGVGILPAVAPQVTISPDGAGANLLRWVHAPANSTGYEVWWSADPYFAPGDSDAQKVALPAPAGTHTDAGEPGQNRYYLVLGVNAAGQASAPSNRTGRFWFALE